jgi:hypothetical protein
MMNEAGKEKNPAKAPGTVVAFGFGSFGSVAGFALVAPALWLFNSALVENDKSGSDQSFVGVVVVMVILFALWALCTLCVGGLGILWAKRRWRANPEWNPPPLLAYGLLALVLLPTLGPVLWILHPL